MFNALSDVIVVAVIVRVEISINQGKAKETERIGITKE